MCVQFYDVIAQDVKMSDNFCLLLISSSYEL